MDAVEASRGVDNEVPSILASQDWKRETKPGQEELDLSELAEAEKGHHQLRAETRIPRRDTEFTRSCRNQEEQQTVPAGSRAYS